MPRNSGTTRAEIASWVDVACRRLVESRWGPVLRASGVDALDALRSPIYLQLIQLADIHGELGRPHRGPTASLVRRAVARADLMASEYKARALTAPAKAAPVVFWPRDVTHLSGQLPVARALGELGVAAFFVACRPSMFEMLRAAGIAPLFMRGAWPRPLRAAAQDGRNRAASLPLDPGVSLPPPPWGGDAARPLNTVRDVLRSFLPLVHETAAAAELVIERFSPRVLVVGNDITLEGRIAAAKARRVGLPTVCLMHGSLAGNPLQRHHCADRLLVYGPGPRDLLVALGIAAERVIVCGAPYLDGMPRPSDQPHPAIRRAFGVGPGTPWALVATSGPGDSVSASHHRAVVEAVTRLSVQMPDVSFIAKLHRKDRPEIYERARRAIAGSRLHVVPHGRGGFPAGIFDWLQGSSVVLTGASTVALEAMLMDIPVVTIDLADEFRDVDFIDAGATVHIRHQEDLVPAVRALVTKPDLARDARERGRAFVARYFGAVDGGASRRGAAAVVAAMDLAGRRLRCVVDD